MQTDGGDRFGRSLHFLAANGQVDFLKSLLEAVPALTRRTQLATLHCT
jgi:hypothetical protein